MSKGFFGRGVFCPGGVLPKVGYVLGGFQGGLCPIGGFWRGGFWKGFFWRVFFWKGGLLPHGMAYERALK